ncbi:MAG: hypothetical protein HRU19_00630 [Pseudobacteriovorax sp.]|nr:hypothetical protein [Pseudobacteriovorax sp.]
MNTNKYPLERKVRVLSLGAGVQSSCLAWLYETEKLENLPDFAIFADTGAEPESVYKYLEYLQANIKSFPIYTTSKGNIALDTILNSRFATPPFFIKKPNGKIGMGLRQCTGDYKIKAVQSKIRDVLGYKPRKHMKHKIEVILGISTDEIERMKESRVKWISNSYPLIDGNFSRTDCLEFIKSIGKRLPPKSACWLCPYRSNESWLELKDASPKDFEKAVSFDKFIRNLPKLHHENYLHRSCKPLGEAVLDIDSDGEKDGIVNECEGMCGT